MPYGYLGQNQPNQTVSNSGVFSITDVAELQSQGKLGGSLELIAEQTYSGSVSFVDFTSIQENKYDVHYLSLTNFQTASDNVEVFQIQLYESGVLETASVYQHAFQRQRTTGAVSVNTSTGLGYMKINQNGGNATNEKSCGYVYFYNLGNSSKYSFLSQQSIVTQNDSVQNITFGSGVLPQASTVDGIRIKTSSGNYLSFTAKLYGVKQI